MSWVLQALAQLLGAEPAPGTPEHRDAYLRSCKLLNEAMKKPAAQRDVAWMLEEAKRNLRMGAEYYQAEAEGFQRDMEWWTRCLAAWQAKPASACCPDFVRVHQRMLASFKSRGALNAALARESTVHLQALQEGRPPPPAPVPRFELHLPAGVPQELPPSIDRCAKCQDHLEDAMYRERNLQAADGTDADGYALLFECLGIGGSRPGPAIACHDGAVLGAAELAPAGDEVDLAAAEQEAAAAEQEAAQLEQELAAAREAAAQLEARVAQAHARRRRLQERAEELLQRHQQQQQQQQHAEPA